MRGNLTEEIKRKSEEIIGYKISQDELRLIPYLQFVMVNEQKIDIAKINDDERKILNKWKEMNLLESPASGMKISKKFWDFMCEILFLSYVGDEGSLKEVKE